MPFYYTLGWDESVMSFEVDVSDSLIEQNRKIGRETTFKVPIKVRFSHFFLSSLQESISY